MIRKDYPMKDYAVSLFTFILLLAGVSALYAFALLTGAPR
jgi:hypothetical protein